VQYVSDRYFELEKSQKNPFLISEMTDLLQKEVDGNPQKRRKRT
jgi:hypothetical protein